MSNLPGEFYLHSDQNDDHPLALSQTTPARKSVTADALV